MKNTFLFLFCMFFCVVAKSDEGMWIPGFIPDGNLEKMEKLGLYLTPDEIYKFNGSSLKDAIFQLQDANGNGFCTGEIVSKTGLLFTNHHCAYAAIADISTLENNYLQDGFWAKSPSEEISLPNVKASRVVSISDVTDKVLKNVTDTTTERERRTIISDEIREIENKAVEDTHYKAKVHSMYSGSEFFLFTYEVFGDIRLAGTPESAIGKFGGDTDNWMWPRHTGDFAILRIYMSPDGNPTDSYAENNIPYQPLHSLPISLRGVEIDDFAMILGFPGTTDRYLSSYGMKYKRDYFNPSFINMLDKRVEILSHYMKKDDAVRLAYSNVHAALANVHKLFTGEKITLERTNAINDKIEYEKEFQKWINQDEERKEKYGEILENYKDLYASFGPITREMFTSAIGLMQAGEKVSKAMEFVSLRNLLENSRKNSAIIDDLTAAYLSELDDMFDEYFPKVDKAVFEATLLHYLEFVAPENRSGVFNDFIFDKYDGGLFKTLNEEQMVQEFIKDVFNNSLFTCKDRMKNFLEKPRLRTIKNDPLFLYYQKVTGSMLTDQMTFMSFSNRIKVNERLYIEAMRKFEYDKDFYPDANSTLRLSYGTVQSYYPRDAVYYKHITYIDGIIEKKDPNHHEFIVPEKLVELYNKQSFGRYVDNTGNLPVNFITNNDITGGNSGSPVINGRGELIGIAFDGNWEWLCSNLIYNHDLQRTINVDVRYVLWVIDKIYGAKNIIQELDIVE